MFRVRMGFCSIYIFFKQRVLYTYVLNKELGFCTIYKCFKQRAWGIVLYRNVLRT